MESETTEQHKHIYIYICGNQYKRKNIWKATQARNKYYMVNKTIEKQIIYENDTTEETIVYGEDSRRTNNRWKAKPHRKT